MNQTSKLAESFETAEYIPLLNFEESYEILNYYPFTIRNKDTLNELKGIIDNEGYHVMKLNRKMYKKHRLIALQFIANDDPALKIVVDHINHDPSDNHIENLRWVDSMNNAKNKSSHNGIVYEFVDTISDEAIVVNEYGTHQFEDLYYHDDKFYFYNGKQYRILHVNQKRHGSLFVQYRDTDKKLVQIFYSKFKQLYNIDE